VWVAGLTADLPRLPPSCEGMRRGSGADEGVPPCGGPLSPCRQQVVWGAAAPKEYPVWGASGSPDTRQLPDVYWIILDALLSLTTSPGKAGLRVQTGDRHTREHGAACRGPPVVRERSGIIWTLRPIGSRGSYRDGETISDESDDIRKPQKRSENYDDSDDPTAPITLTG
jgi:hypothetical protein